MSDFRGKNVIITGSSAGLGLTIAFAFAAQGASVGLIARSEDALKGAIAILTRTHPTRTAYAVADVSDDAQLAEATSAIVAQLGSCDIWVNNAMETVFSPFDSMTPEEFRRVTDVNYLGYVYGTQEALKLMRPKGKGHIIQVGSALAYRSIPLQAAYCGSKAAIRAFTDSLRSELIRDKSEIKLTMVQMPALNTPQFSWARTHITHHPRPVGTIFQPELGASAIIHAARFPRREYWVGGSSLAAIIGNKFFPGWMDRKMAESAYEQQWMPERPTPPREGNLLAPGEPHVHRMNGIFDHSAKPFSWAWEFVKFGSILLSMVGL